MVMLKMVIKFSISTNGDIPKIVTYTLLKNWRPLALPTVLF